MPAHTAVKHELLVRCLDAWAPAALHGHKRICYVSWAGVESAITALRVFAEFADLLERHRLTMLVPTGVLVPEGTIPAGVEVSTVAGALTAPPKNQPMFGWFDSAVDAAELAAVARASGAQLLVATAPGASRSVTATLATARVPLVCRVELVDAAGQSELLIFGTSSEKALEQFKDELWALDEYAGIRLRDPSDVDGALLDISAVAHLGPLRRTLLRQVRTSGQATLGELRAWTLHETIFRSSDATRAVHAMVSAGTVSREPLAGRLSADTVLRPAASDPNS